MKTIKFKIDERHIQDVAKHQIKRKLTLKELDIVEGEIHDTVVVINAINDGIGELIDDVVVHKTLPIKNE